MGVVTDVFIKYLGWLLILFGAFGSQAIEPYLSLPSVKEIETLHFFLEVAQEILKAAVIAGIIHIFIEFKFVRKTIYNDIKKILTQKVWLSSIDDTNKIAFLDRIRGLVYGNKKIKENGLNKAIEDMIPSKIPFFYKKVTFKLNYEKVKGKPDILKVTRNVIFQYQFTDYCPINKKITHGFGLELEDNDKIPKDKDGPLISAKIKFNNEEWEDNHVKPVYEDNKSIAEYSLEYTFLRKKEEIIDVNIEQVYYIPIEDNIIHYRVGKTPVCNAEFILSGNIFGKKGSFYIIPCFSNASDNKIGSNHSGNIINIKVKGWMFNKHGLVIIRKPQKD